MTPVYRPRAPCLGIEPGLEQLLGAHWGTVQRLEQPFGAPSRAHRRADGAAGSSGVEAVEDQDRLLAHLLAPLFDGLLQLLHHLDACLVEKPVPGFQEPVPGFQEPEFFSVPTSRNRKCAPWN